MPRGGKRPGSGRPKGAKSKMSELHRREALATGISPLEFMLAVLRDEERPFDVRMDAAKAAAPFMHARLASVEQTVTHKTDAAEYSESELADIIASASSPRAAQSANGKKQSHKVH